MLVFSFFAPAVSARANQTRSLTNISIVSADIHSGRSLAGACYILIDYSEEGCDENGDGQVDFADVAVGTYTVIQTGTPNGYSPVLGTEITVTAANNGSRQLFSINHRDT